MALFNFLHFLLLPTLGSFPAVAFFLKSFKPSISGEETVAAGEETDETISVSHLKVLFHRLGMEWEEDSDEGEEGTHPKSVISRKELTSILVEEPCLDEIKQCFGVFDENGDGFIDAFELQRVLVCLGLDDELQDCKKMIVAVDDNGDGLIDFQEFAKLLESGFF